MAGAVAGVPAPGGSEPRFVDLARGSAAHVLVEDLDSPVLDEADRHHLGSVLRLREEEIVSATDGRGGWRMCRFAAGGRLVAEGTVGSCDRPVPALCVAFAPVKGDRTEWAVQKLTELGVDRIALLNTERGVVRWEGARAESHLRKLRAVARQALMQSRGLWMPSVEGIIGFEDAAALPGAALAEPGGSPISLAAPTVLVGPEGGWSDRERTEAAGRTVSLGAGVLRAETAAVAAGVLLTALRAGIVAAQ
ncbi:MAG TPA: RsmE family RNA methyltransferase [Acidimicrobiales bacterium]|nr:RsmE family RNA methyltransferase [Acidimicrobiales bacterium]